MRKVRILPIENYGYNFIPAEYIPDGKDEYWLRDEQHENTLFDWRNLNSEEIETLNNNRNYCSDWNKFLVKDPFEPALICDSYFYGLVRIGVLNNILLKYNDFCIPAGIRGSTIISCDIGNDTAIQDCAYISHYVIGDNCILSNIDEIQTTNHAKFGNGVLVEGEDEDIRVWIDVMNEAGGRSILPFQDMIAADAYLWAAYRDDNLLTDKLKEITQKQYGGQRGRYGTIGSGTVIKSCAIIKDAVIGECAYIKGANKLKNVTIHSSPDEPTQIGEGVELVNGIVGFACSIFYGSKAVRFVMGRNSNLKYGARLIHSVLGDNSTVSCCEILNNLIFPVHEQHHNNSFLIASLIQGMSNMAAAATIGSNHNSRANDGEIRAGRGFWPGLAVSLKHSSRFASYTIISKGSYPFELDIPLPFSLVNNNIHKNRLEVMPAYFWLHNLYALERNSWKSRERDKRKIKIQQIETDYLAPDTAEEIINALSLLEGWIGESGYSTEDMVGNSWSASIRNIPCRDLEEGGKSRSREQVIIKPLNAIAAYRQMLSYYSIKTITSFFDSHKELDYQGLHDLLAANSEERIKNWVNFGGQIVPAYKVDELRKEIGEGKYNTWDEIHQVYKNWNETYTIDKCRHAWAVMIFLNGNNDNISTVRFVKELTSAAKIRNWINRQIFESREKDFKSTIKKSTFRNQEEMENVLGKTDNNPFVQTANKESKEFFAMIERAADRVMGTTENLG